MRRRWLQIASAVVGVLVLLAIIGNIVGPQTKPASKAAATPEPAASTSSPEPSSTAPSSPVPAPDPAPAPASDTPSAEPAAGLTCAQVGGVFVKHGTDGRGDCEPADPRPHCHVPPAQQDGNYVAVLTMTPPFADGTIDSPFLIGMASNADCWKLPAK